MSTPALQLRTRVPRIAGAAVERARLSVVPRRRTNAARMPFVMLVSLVLLLGVIGLLLFNTSMQQAAFAATTLEERASSLTAREQTLQMELDVLRDPQNVAEAAQKQGMVLPCGSATLRLSDGKVVGEPCAASVADGLRLHAMPPAKPAILTPPVRHVEVPASGTGRGSGGGDGQRGDNGRDRNDNADDSADRR
jgi:hypothetical protein